MTGKASQGANMTEAEQAAYATGYADGKDYGRHIGRLTGLRESAHLIRESDVPIAFKPDHFEAVVAWRQIMGATIRAISDFLEAEHTRKNKD